MTEQEAKDRLEKVQVRMGDGTILEGSPAGRNEKFAKVFVMLHSSPVCLGEWTWKAIAAAATKGTPLQA